MKFYIRDVLNSEVQRIDWFQDKLILHDSYFFYMADSYDITKQKYYKDNSTGSDFI